MIKGGYYIKARAIQESDIAHAAPCVREIWDYLLREASFEDTNKSMRGQLVRTMGTIREALSWYVGYRKMTYSMDQCEAAMKWLRSREMVTTTKTTRGIIITVCKYAYYQNQKNYENRTVTEPAAGIKPEYTGTINKKGRIKEENNTGATAPGPAPVLKLVTDIDTQFLAFTQWLEKYAPRVLKLSNPITMEEYHRFQQEFDTPILKKLLQEILIAMHNWKPLLTKSVSANLTAREWMRKRMKDNPSLYEINNENGLNKPEQGSAREIQGEETLRSIIS